MPRTTIVLQSEREPLAGELEFLLNGLLNEARGQGIEPKSAIALAPVAEGPPNTLIMEKSARRVGL